MDADLSNREEFRLTWLRVFLLSFGLTLMLWSGTALFDVFVRSLNYFDRFPLYLWFSILIYGLGAGGLRSARQLYPRESSLAECAADTATASGLGVTPLSPGDNRQADWVTMAKRWSRLVREEEWWREPDLTAPLLARRLATNTSYLSRALNDGLGQNFNQFINRLRVEAVHAELARPEQNRDVLEIALDAGFNSKASFNRVFKRLCGETPTEFRRRHGQ